MNIGDSVQFGWVKSIYIKPQAKKELYQIARHGKEPCFYDMPMLIKRMEQENEGKAEVGQGEVVEYLDLFFNQL